MDCLLKRESDESSSSGKQNYDKDPQCNENMDFHSDREPAVPRTEFQTHIRNVAICRKENRSVGSGTDGRNSDIGDLADFSSDEEESQVE